MKLKRYIVALATLLVLLGTFIGTPGTPRVHADSPSSVAWPVNTQTQQWMIIQGYNNCSDGGDHGDDSGKKDCQYPNPSQLYGFDLALSNGVTAKQPVYSPVNGTVETSIGKTNDTTGDCIFVDLSGTSNPTIMASLCHVENYSSFLGKPVTQGEQIATIASTANHLHFNLRDSNLSPIVFTNPYGILQCDGTPRDWTSDGSDNQYAKKPTTIGGCAMPGGWWIGPTPSDWNQTTNSTIQLGFQVDSSNTQHGGVSYVNFTQWNTATSTWSVLASHVVPDSNHQVFATDSLFHSGTVYGADVYATDGTANLSPSGVRHVCYGTVCPPQTLNYWNNQQVGGGQSNQSTDGITIWSGTNNTGSSETFTYTSDNTCISLDQMAGKNESVQFIGSYNTNDYNAIMYHDTNCGTYLAQYNGKGSSDIGSGLYNQFGSMQLHNVGTNSVTIYQHANDSGTQESFQYSSDSTCVNLDQMAGHNGSVALTGSYANAYNVVMYHDTSCGTYLAQYSGTGSSDIGSGLYDQFGSMKIERVNDTTCPVDQTTANGVLLIRDGGFSLNGGCKLITSDQNDLDQVTWKGFSGLKFLGNYKLHYQVLMYKDANYGNYCGTYFLDQSWLLGNCGDNQIDSIHIQSFTAPAAATNLAPTATRDHAGTDAVVDDNLSTEWVGSNKSPLGFVWSSPQTIQSFVAFDRGVNSQGEAIGRMDVLFSDGSIIHNVDMTPQGQRCADVKLTSPKTVSWINFIPTDASDSAGFKEIQIFANDGTPLNQNTCPGQFTLTPTTDVGLAPVPLGQEIPASCVPGANQVALFTGRNYSGQCNVLGIGNYANAPATGLPNDSLWSLKIGTGVKVNVWWNENFTGGEGIFSSNAPDLQTSGADREMSSLQVLSTSIDYSAPWISCAEEGGGLCVVSGTDQVRYGANSTWLYQTVTGSIDCTTTAFGGVDPLPGTHKHCEYQNIGQPIPTQTPSPTPSPTPVSTGFSAEYYNNQTLSGNPTLMRNDPSINFDWGSGSPDGSIPNDHFSARWTKVDTFAQGDYQFSMTGDDGIRLYIDNNLVIDKWVDQGPTTYTAIQTLSAGTHTLKMEYYENGGGATAKLSYQQITVGSNYTGEYYDNQSLSGTPRMVRLDPSVNFNWGGGSPDSTIPVDHFSARWTKIDTFVSGGYQFSVTGDDGIRLYIDGNLVIDKWIDQGPTTYTTIQALSAGSHTIKMEFYENGGGATAILSYSPIDIGSNYVGEYYDNQSLSGTPRLVRLEQSVNNDWGGGSPDGTIPVDHFSARWTQSVSLNQGNYQFSITGDDGVRLYVDGQLVIDKWVDQGPTTYTTTLALSAGSHTIKMEYYENGGGATAKLSYQQV